MDFPILLLNSRTALMNVSAAGAGELAVNFQQGFVGTEAEDGMVFLVLGEAENKLAV